jgi:flagellar hook-associated protein 1 FlgK
MSLTQSLSTALAGLRVTQAGLSVVAGNVANANTAGYITKNLNQVAVSSAGAGDSVRVESVNRVLDQFVQAQLRTESSGGAFATQRASFHDQLQRIFGQPGSTTTFDSIFNDFTTAAQALATTPDSPSTRTALLGAAQALAQQLNSMTNSVQTLRSQADLGISNDIVLANQALQKIASINQQLATGGPDDNTATVLEDQRDQAIDQLAKLMDIRVVQGANNQITVYSGAGFQLAGTEASRLAFTQTGTITPSMQWNADPTKSDLSTISLIGPDGAATDLLAAGGIRSGEIAAFVEMRDRTLVQAQGQLDELAAQMSKALSDLTTNGAPVTVGPNAGFTVDIANVLPGNTVQITYTDASSVQHKITVVRVEDPAALPLSNSLTPDPNDRVVGISFAGGAAAVAARLTAALGSTGMQFSNPSGSLLQVLNGGLATTVDTLSATATMTSFTSGNPQLPLFTDASAPFTGEITADGTQTTGFAGRIAVNPALFTDPTRLVIFQTAPPTPLGDATRPNFISDQLTSGAFLFSPATGIGGSAAPFDGTLSAFIGQVVGFQAQAANAATNLKDGQEIVVNALQQRFTEKSGVSIDLEMSRLLTLQNAYGANARVMTTVKQMFDILLQM